MNITWFVPHELEWETYFQRPKMQLLKQNKKTVIMQGGQVATYPYKNPQTNRKLFLRTRHWFFANEIERPDLYTCLARIIKFIFGQIATCPALNFHVIIHKIPVADYGRNFKL